MKNKKVLALLVSLVLIVAVALPGTLAVSSDQDAVNSDFTVDTATPAPETQETTGEPEQTVVHETQETTGEPEQTVVPETQETTGEPETPEQPVVPETPEQPEQPAEPVLVCTCDPEPAEGEAHKEGCPLYVAPEAPVVINHIETCLEDCTGEECTCVCHLYEKIMAAETLDEIWMILDEMSDETYNTMTDGMKAKVDEKIVALEPLPAPEIVVEESTDEIVPSEIVYPTVNFTNVAPFVGGQG